MATSIPFYKQTTHFRQFLHVFRMTLDDAPPQPGYFRPQVGPLLIENDKNYKKRLEIVRSIPFTYTSFLQVLHSFLNLFYPKMAFLKLKIMEIVISIHPSHFTSKTIHLTGKQPILHSFWTCFTLKVATSKQSKNGKNGQFGSYFRSTPPYRVYLSLLSIVGNIIYLELGLNFNKIGPGGWNNFIKQELGGVHWLE